MKFYPKICLMMLVAVASSVAHGQSARAFLQKGKQAFYNENYSPALAYFQVIIDEVGPDTDVLFHAAESARQIRSFKVAEEYFSAIPPEEWRGDYALTGYYLGLVKKSLEKYEEAIDQFEIFAAERADLSKYRSKAIIEIRNCEWALEMMKNPVNVEIKHLNEAVNTIYSDYSPVALGDTLFYTSTERVKVDLRKERKEELAEKNSAKNKKKKKKRPTGKKKKKVPNPNNMEERLITKMFYSIDGLTGEPMKQNPRSSKNFAANLAFNTDQSRMYYTVCDQLDPEEQIFRCKIYFRDQSRSGRWGRAVELPDFINAGGSSSTQPSIGLDPETGEEILYFVSDRDGGRGKEDIWLSRIDNNGKFSQPVNLAALNTPDEEVAPFFDVASQTMYFSSNGHQNFGGFDIFSSKKTEDGWAKPENLGYPINSSYDDISYYIDPRTGKAYMASNRDGAFCISPDRDCSLHDIYVMSSHAEAIFTAHDAKDFGYLNGASITLENLTAETSESILLPKEEHDWQVTLNPQHSYRATFAKKGYETATLDILPGDILPKGKEATAKTVLLKPLTKLVVKTMDGVTFQPIYGMSLHITDTETGEGELHQMPPNTSEFRLPVFAGRQYEITAVKEGFDAVGATVSIPDEVPSGEVVEEIMLSPFFGGLPLDVFFDNNAPAQPNLTYEETYESYIQKKAEFIVGYADGASGMAGQVARMEASRFFQTKIQSGYYELLRVTENILFALQEGQHIELHIEGYASPLADNDYNKKLSERRIRTVVNYFEKYKDGALRPYLGKQLTIIEIPFGERQTQGEVSDSVSDKKASVYSPKASLERKVTIGGFRLFDVPKIENSEPTSSK